MKYSPVLSLLFTTAVSAYVPAGGAPRTFVPRGTSSSSPAVVNAEQQINGHTMHMTSSGTSTTSAVTDFLKDLLEHLDGQKLLANSSESWRKAIFEAVGAPETADEKLVAKALGDAMSHEDNQFAILMGHGEPFVATFPSDPVEDSEKGETWVECRLRGAEDDELLVTMGITLQNAEDGAFLIRSLDWQDFRDKFYPGLSGREWLRAF